MGNNPNRTEPISLIKFLFVITITVVLTFSAVISYPFSLVDDPSYITGNAMVRAGLEQESIEWAFSTRYYGNYAPLTWISHMLDVELYGDWAGGHHLNNLLFHVASTLLIFIFFVSTSKQIGVSFLISIFFAIHPLKAEPVIWISSRKDVLSAFFMALTLLAYSKFVKAPALSTYLLVLFLFLSGLLAKSVLVTLPFLLLLLDYWPLNRFTLDKENRRNIWRLLLEKLPLVFISAIFVWLTFHSQSMAGNVEIVEHVPTAQKVLNIFPRYVFYLEKIFFPFNLGFPYPKFSWSLSAQIACLLIVLALSMLAICNARKRAYLVVGWFWYLIALLPYVQFSQIGLQELADRWLYLPLLGISIVCFGTANEIVKAKNISQKLTYAVSTILVVVLALLTLRQVFYWKEPQRLYTKMIENYPNSYLAYIYRAEEFQAKGRTEEALNDYRYIQSKIPIIYVFEKVAAILSKQNRIKELIDLINDGKDSGSNDDREKGRILAVLANYPEASDAYFDKYGKDALSEAEQFLNQAYHNAADDRLTLRYLASYYLSLNEYQLAEKYLRELINLYPQDADALNNLGFIHYRNHNQREALTFFQRAAFLDPTEPEIFVNVGNILNAQGNPKEALSYGLKALLISPNNAPAHLLLGSSYLAMSEFDRAIKEFELTLKNNPTSIEACNSLGVLYFKKAELIKAIDIFSQCILINPNVVAVYENRAAIYQQLGNEQAAKQDLDKVRELTRSN